MSKRFENCITSSNIGIKVISENVKSLHLFLSELQKKKKKAKSILQEIVVW